MRKGVIFGLTLIFLVVSDGTFAETPEDLKFGFFVDRLATSSQTVVFDERLNQRINEIGAKLVRGSGKPLSKYTFRVINDPVINAYSAAGGYIYINTGLLDTLESEDELAAIMAHEIAHTNNNHQLNSLVSIHRMKVTGQVASIILSYSFSIAMSYGPTAAFSSAGSAAARGIAKGLSQVTSNVTSEVGSSIGSQIGLALTMSMIKGYGRSQELEADTLAVKNMHKAGYNPNAFIGVFKRLISIRERLGPKKDSYLSNLINAEPGLEERLKNAEDLLPKVK